MERDVEMMTRAVLLAAGLMLVAGTAQAVEPDDAIAYRKAVMDSIGGHTTGVALAAQGKIADPAALKAHADMLVRSSTLALAAFKENTASKGKEQTTAKADIWAKWPDFEKDMKAMQAQAQKLASAATTGGAKAAAAELPALSKSCKACHDDFRQKK